MSLQSKLALHDFAHGWDLTTNNAGFYWFRALVRIRGGFHIQEETEVTIRTTGYEDGQIEIAATARLVAGPYHLGFSANFQTYAFDEQTGQLEVQCIGTAQKMKGPYRIEIIPLGYTRK